MGLRSWLLRNRLQSVERSLRKKRYLMKKLRDRMDGEEADKARLEAERSRLTSQIEVLVTKEKALKEELAGPQA